MKKIINNILTPLNPLKKVKRLKRVDKMKPLKDVTKEYRSNLKICTECGKTVKDGEKHSHFKKIKLKVE